MGDFWRVVWQYKVTHIVMVTGVCEAGKVGLLCVCARERVGMETMFDGKLQDRKHFIWKLHFKRC